MPPLFSIITVTRNHLGGLQKTASRLRKQNFPDYEWIIMDGASTDGTTAWLSAQDIPFHSAPDRGPYDGMNGGIDRAQGTYLIFMNAGDQFTTPDTLSIIAAHTQNNPDFLYGDAYEDDNETHFYKKTRSHHSIAYGMFTHHQAMVYRRAHAPCLRYDLSYPIAADYNFTLRFLKTAQTMIRIPQPLCVFESGGLSQKNALQGRKEQYIIRRKEGYTAALNMLIAGLHRIAWRVRRLCPALYRFFKSVSIRA